MDEAIALSKEVGEQIATLYQVPVFLYEKSATAPHRENLAAVRKGEFEGMAEKIKLAVIPTTHKFRYLKRSLLFFVSILPPEYKEE